MDEKEALAIARLQDAARLSEHRYKKPLMVTYSGGKDSHADANFIYGIESVLEYAENLPAADVVPVRHGHWKTTDGLLGRCCVCSVCGSCPTMEYKYCPYCGSLMSGGAENA